MSPTSTSADSGNSANEYHKGNIEIDYQLPPAPGKRHVPPKLLAIVGETRMRKPKTVRLPFVVDSKVKDFAAMLRRGNQVIVHGRIAPRLHILPKDHPSLAKYTDDRERQRHSRIRYSVIEVLFVQLVDGEPQDMSLEGRPRVDWTTGQIQWRPRHLDLHPEAQALASTTRSRPRPNSSRGTAPRTGQAVHEIPAAMLASAGGADPDEAGTGHPHALPPGDPKVRAGSRTPEPAPGLAGGCGGRSHGCGCGSGCGGCGSRRDGDAARADCGADDCGFGGG